MTNSLYPLYPVLLVDDKKTALQSYEIVLRSSGINHLICCEDSRQVVTILADNKVEVLLLDLSMPHVSGEEILAAVTQDYPEVPVIIVTGANDVDTAVRCMQSAAFDYMVKPVEKSRLISGVKRAVEFRELRREAGLLRKHILSLSLEHPEAFEDIVTRDNKMRSIFQYAEAVAKTLQPVLVTGETGVGKELMARAIHKINGNQGPFVALNVAGLDDTVFSDTLFGHKRGAFTGADEVRSGLVEKASGGILFLDEIGDLSASSQVKLLRLVQEREYFPLGIDVAKRCECRIIVSTNRDLQTMMTTGQFRKDLYYRLCIHHIHIPPLRERPGDLPLLIDRFLEKAASTLGKKKPTPPPELFDLLATYHFPGNIRELESMIMDAVSKHKSRKLSLDTFKEYIFQDQDSSSVERMDTLQPLTRTPIHFAQQLPTIKEATQHLIEEAMNRAHGNQTVAAQLLGISQQALSKRLKTMTNHE